MREKGAFWPESAPVWGKRPSKSPTDLKSQLFSLTQPNPRSVFFPEKKAGHGKFRRGTLKKGWFPALQLPSRIWPFWPKIRVFRRFCHFWRDFEVFGRFPGFRSSVSLRALDFWNSYLADLPRSSDTNHACGLGSELLLSYEDSAESMD